MLLFAACSPLSDTEPKRISFSPESSVSSELPETKTARLLAGFESKSDYAWFRRIGAFKVQGDVESGLLELTIRRKNGQNDGFDALGLYVAEINENGQIIKETKSTRYIDSHFIGNCKRQLKPEPYDLNTLGNGLHTAKYSLNGIPVTTEDECESGTEQINLKELINGNGVIIGFLPSSERVTFDVSLDYEGELTAERYEW